MKREPKNGIVSKRLEMHRLFLSFGTILFLMSSAQAQIPMGTAFTYQGNLKKNNFPTPGLYDPATGTYDFEFKLFDDPTTGTLLGTNLKDHVKVKTGQFTVLLDFGGNVFAGDARWLQVAVRRSDTDELYTILLPRHELTPVPYALFSANGGTSNGTGRAKHLIVDLPVAPGQYIIAGDVVGLTNGAVIKGFASDPVPKFVFNPAQTGLISLATISPTQFVVTYQNGDWSGIPMAIVGTCDGNAITYGPPVACHGEMVWMHLMVLPLDSARVMVVGVDRDEVTNLNLGFAKVGTINGTTITFGPEYSFGSGRLYELTADVLSSNEAILVFRDNTGHMAMIADATGDAISYGSSFAYPTDSSTATVSAAALSATQFVIARTDGTEGFGTAMIGTSSGGALAFGPTSVFSYFTGTNGLRTLVYKVIALTPTRFGVFFADDGNQYAGTAIFGDVNGDVISFGRKCVFNPSRTSGVSAVPMSSSQFLTSYRNFGNSDFGTLKMGDSEGNAVTFSGGGIFNASFTENTALGLLSPTRYVVAYENLGNQSFGAAAFGPVPDRAVVPLGIAKSNASEGGVVSVITDGTSDVHSNLAPGKFYFAQPDGSLTLVKTDVPVGLAVSPTEILLRGDFGQPQQ